MSQLTRSNIQRKAPGKKTRLGVRAVSAIVLASVVQLASIGAGLSMLLATALGAATVPSSRTSAQSHEGSSSRSEAVAASTATLLRVIDSLADDGGRLVDSSTSDRPCTLLSEHGESMLLARVEGTVEVAPGHGAAATERIVEMASRGNSAVWSADGSSVRVSFDRSVSQEEGDPQTFDDALTVAWTAGADADTLLVTADEGCFPR
ncbi:hypothetical protein [Plantibacter sp. RU18]|uniref:hypothetical protein n=1 Tax=Plantibacter sp. RU18 TaxID=3158143 RepID=UPI003D361AAA